MLNEGRQQLSRGGRDDAEQCGRHCRAPKHQLLPHLKRVRKAAAGPGTFFFCFFLLPLVVFPYLFPSPKKAKTLARGRTGNRDASGIVFFSNNSSNLTTRQSTHNNHSLVRTHVIKNRHFTKQMAAMQSPKAKTILGMCNPLLDISAVVPASVFEK